MDTPGLEKYQFSYLVSLLIPTQTLYPAAAMVCSNQIASSHTPNSNSKPALGFSKGPSSPKWSGPHYFSSIRLLPSSLSIFQLHHFLSAPQIMELLSASVHLHLLFISSWNILLQNAQLSSPVQLSSKVTPSGVPHHPTWNSTSALSPHRSLSQ